MVSNGMSSAYKNNVYEVEPMIKKQGVYCMYAGALLNVDEEFIDLANEAVISADYRRGLSNGYFQSDLNMDGFVNITDASIVKANLSLGVYTQGVYFVRR